MKTILIVIAIYFAAYKTYAQTNPQQTPQNFYECTLPQAEEYRVGIDISKNTASFFDNDTTSIMTYQGYRPSSRNAENNVLIYAGKDLGGSGDLKLEFNMGTKRIKLSTVETDGTIELLGFAACKPAKALDL